ncbi:hypothetical protein SCHPADRAFT_937722 [Schizopora paradoxa]|uniref:Protein kinase domain-containing protein n=1 Tax=Schizopora paradoxa TaxID=27342 RepID=A0A0H2RX84_9AGAM|nr:hypothetical protein SCHPADRAFT_937722 [Schizopora paradoxa]
MSTVLLTLNVGRTQSPRTTSSLKMEDIDGERKMEDLDIVIGIYDLLLLYKSSVAERHISWIAGHNNYSDAVKRNSLEKYCAEITRSASSNSSSTRIAALKAICALTVEEPVIRVTFKERTNAICCLKGLKMSSTEFEIREWASKALDAIQNEEVHELWSNVITQPVRFEDTEKLSKGTVSYDNRKLGKLANSLKNPNSSYVAELYLRLATEQASEGPSRNDLANMCYHIRRLGREGSLPSQSLLPNDRSIAIIEQFCRKLLKYTKRANTAVAAMEEVILLATEDCHIRKTLKECEDELRCLQKRVAAFDSNPEFRKWAQRALCAIRNEDIHELWSSTTAKSTSWPNLRKILEGQVPLDEDNTSRLAMLAKSLKSGDENSSYIAGLYLERVMKRTTETIAKDIRRVLQHKKANIFQGQARTAHNATSGIASVTELCGNLLEISKHAVATIMAAKEIIALSIENPYVRETFHGRRRIRHLKSMTTAQKNLESPDIFEWASRAVHAIEDEKLHGLWSKAITRRLSASEVQHLIERSVTNDECNLAELARSLKSDPGDVHSAYLAFQYLKRAHEQLKETKAQTQDRISECPSCKREPQRTQQTSTELLRYVLQSATNDSLRNLTGIITMRNANQDFTKVNMEGGFAVVYEGSARIKGIRVAVKQLRINKESVEFVIKNFARELRIFAKIKHPNVAMFLGYIMEEENSGYSIVLEWMEKGSLREALKSDDPILHTPVKLIGIAFGIAKGVSYLHGEKIVHADIKAANVLMSFSGRPLLTDFGIARMSESLYSNGFYTTKVSRASDNWLPFEFYNTPDSDKFLPSTKSDVWAYGMTLFELLSRKIPYEGVHNAGAISRKIINHELPKKPEFEAECEEVKSEIWRICEQSWTKEMKVRPGMQAIVKELIKAKYRLAL